MSYYSDTETDKRLAKLEKRIQAEYSSAAAEMRQRADDYFFDLNNRRFAEEYEAYLDGKYTAAEFVAWHKTQIARGEGYRTMADKLTSRVVDANKVAEALINDTTPGIYSLNYNYEAYRINQAYGIDFHLLDETTLLGLFSGENHVRFKTVSVNPVRDYEWNRRKMDNALISGILQGKSIDQLADGYMDVMKRNRTAAIRNARTSVTSAQNSGRMETYRRATAMGIDLQKEWIATLDSRTRETHMELDGERQSEKDPFSNGLMYPGDPKGDPAEVYNCRCTTRAILPGVNDSRNINRAYKGADGHREYDVNGNPLSAQGVNYKGKDAISFADYLNGKRWGDDPMLQAKEDLADLVRQRAGAQDAVDAFKIDTYSGIWRTDVTTADYRAKESTIQAKRDYYDAEMLKAVSANDQAKIDEILQKVKLLDEFETRGKEYYTLVDKRDSFDKLIKDKQLEIKKLNGYDPMLDPYSQERKDAALWAKNTKEADDYLRDKCGEVWRNSSKKERTAIYDYTWTYSPYNEPLRGIQYGLGGTSAGYKGVGKVDLNAGGRGESINLMTDIINKSTYDGDVWLQRGVRFGGMDKFFGVDMNLLRNGTQAELEQALLGTQPVEYGFMSCGVAKGKGFSGDIILNVYAPEGTKMMYAEPFSKFGNGSGANWDGIATQNTFGSESEIILQQGTMFRVTKVEKTSGMIYIDMEVIGNVPEQRWK